MRKQVLAVTIGVLLVLSVFSVLQFWQIKPAQATDSIFGNNVEGGLTNNFPTGYLDGCKFSTVEAGTINKLSIYCAISTGTGPAKAAIYSDDVGTPTTWLANSSAITVTSTPGWVDFPISFVTSASTTYWLCAYSGIDNLNLYNTTGSTNQTAYSTSGTYPTLPTPFGASSYHDFNMSFYATYTPITTDWNWMGGNYSGYYNVTAATGSQSDIQDSIDDVADNGTFPSAGCGNVFVSAGTWHWTVTEATIIALGLNCSIVIPPGVNVFGAGPAGCGDHPTFTNYTAQTIIILDGPYPTATVQGPTIFGIDGQNVSGKTVRVAGIEFWGTAPATQVDEYNGSLYFGNGIFVYASHNYRIDHCSFINFGGNSGGTAVFAYSGDGLCEYGIIDHCLVTCLYKLSNSDWVWGYGFYGMGHWSPPADWYDVTDFFGQYVAIIDCPIMYVEDCHFSYMRHSLDGCLGAYYVARFCLFDNSLNEYACGMADLHGTPDSVGAGGRGNEVYNCTFIGPALGGWWVTTNWAYQLRGGSGLFYNNTFLSNDSSCNMVLLSMQDDMGYEYPAYDVNNTYLWSNTYNGTLCTGTTSNYIEKFTGVGDLIENEEYFLRAPTLPLDGFVYASYVYPHPLVDSSGTQTVAVDVASPVNATYTVSSISVEISATGGTIDTIQWNCTFTNSTVVYANQTYTVTTTMTLANGNYIFNVAANNTDGNQDVKTVWFTVSLTGGTSQLIVNVWWSFYW